MNENKPTQQEMDVADLESKEMKEAETEFWNFKSKMGNDFLKMQAVRDNGIQHVKIIAYTGMKKTNFPEKENFYRPNFDVEVVTGKNKGALYSISLSLPTIEGLGLGKDFKKYEGTILTTTIKQKGKFEGIDYSVYVPLTV